MAVDYQRKLFHTDDSELSVLMKIYDISERMFEESVERLNDWYKLQPHLPKIEIGKHIINIVIIYIITCFHFIYFFSIFRGSVLKTNNCYKRFQC